MPSLLRNGIVMAITAHALVGLSLLWDKVLLRRPATQNLLSYVFWMGAMSIFGVVLAFSGFHLPAWPVAALAFAAGATQLPAIYYYYLALKRGEASETLAVMGGFAPVATALAGAAVLEYPIGRHNALAFSLMVAGGFVMFFAEKLDYRKLLPPVLLSSALYGALNVAQKIAFQRSDFISGYVFFTLGTFAGAMLLLARPAWRRQIFENTAEARPTSAALYFVNRFANGLGSFLIFYAISLANPAMVDAISGVRYAVIFAGAWCITRWKPAWMREEFRGAALAAKAAATLLVIAGLVLAGGSYSNETKATPNATMQAPSQRSQRTSSRSRNLANSVSNR